ncbi:MAG TPA: nucleotide exchange factor GrpE, partial [Pyrinomonadaceae bacterium]|nr:nucleotide exchange factor GrpE [Pyrinomonadaceae bacterium]
MESLGQAQDKISGDDTYQVTAKESREILDHEATRIDQQLAEFDSYRRRTRKELAEAQQSKREVLLALIDVMDDCDRALL